MERIFDCDPVKQAKLLAERDLNLLSMGAVFGDEKRIEFVDTRRDYGKSVALRSAKYVDRYLPLFTRCAVLSLG
jgi:hypothetical protein